MSSQIRLRGGWYGITYKWLPDGSDAELVDAAGEEVSIDLGEQILQWRYPSRQECFQCHTEASGYVLGFKEHQLNSEHDFGSGLINQLLHHSLEGSIRPAYQANTLSSINTASAVDNLSASLEDRSRSYIDSNCAHCHQPDGPGGRALFDARFSTPLNLQEIVRGDVVDDLGTSGAQVILPGVPDASILLQRINTLDGCCRMPPLARNLVDAEAVQVIARWIWELAPATTEPDTDLDGLRDEWELVYAADLTVLGDQDTDGDGYSDHTEYLMGSNPNDGASRVSPTLRLNNQNQHLLQWNSVLGKSYRLQSSSDLEGWTTNDSVHWGDGNTSSIPISLGETEKFFRLLIE